MPGELVLDASALLAYLQLERGEEAVTDALAEGAVISSVNLAEVVEVISRGETDPGELATEMDRSGLLHSAILVEEFTYDDSIEVVRLRSLTQHLGLSLAERACLALALRTDFPVLTADQAWAKLEIGVDIRLIR